MIKVLIIRFGNESAIVERDSTRYRIPLEVLTFSANPRYGYVHPNQLTAARVIQ